MADEPAFVQESDLAWEGWAEDQVAQRGSVKWKTLISAGMTPSRGLTAGVALIAPGGDLRPHHHSQAEIYLVLEGTGEVMIEGAARAVGAGTTVFIPGDAVHSIENHGATELRFAYVLQADSFDDVEYVF